MSPLVLAWAKTLKITSRAGGVAIFLIDDDSEMSSYLCQAHNVMGYDKRGELALGEISVVPQIIDRACGCGAQQRLELKSGE